MDKLQFYITETGRTALAAATAAGDALAIQGIALIDAQQTGSLSQVGALDGLDGEVVFYGSVAGASVGIGSVQFEAFDMSDSVYEARTVALYFTGEGGQRMVFAVATSSDVVVYKTAFTSSSAVFVMEIDETDAMSLTFSNVTLTTPPATKERLGVVKLCPDGGVYASVESPDANPSMPTVATPISVVNGIKKVLGDKCFDGDAVIGNTATVGGETRLMISSGWLKVDGIDGLYEHDLGADFDIRTAYAAHGWINGESITALPFSMSDSHYVHFVSQTTNKAIGTIIGSNGTWVLRSYSRIVSTTEVAPVVDIFLRNAGTIDAIETEQHTVKASELAVGSNVTVGARKALTLDPLLWTVDDEGDWRYYGIDFSLIGGELVDDTYVVIDGVKTTASYDYDSRTVSFPGTGLTLSVLGVLSYTFEGTPPAATLFYTSHSEISSTHAVKAYGHDIMRAHGCLGWIKFRYTNTAIEGEQLFIVDAYQMTLQVVGSTLRVSFSKPSGASDLRSVFRVSGTETTVNFFDCVASGNVFGGGSTNRVFDVQGVDTASITFDTNQSFYGMIKVF